MAERNGQGKYARVDAGQREAQILRYAKEGLTGPQIAPRVGCSHGHVCRILRRYGIHGTRGRREKAKLTHTFPGSEYNDEERLYLVACDRYRQKAGKKFLTALDHLKVLKGMGYRRG